MRRLRNKTAGELQKIIDSNLRKPKVTFAKVVLVIFWCFCGVCFWYSVFFAEDVLFDMKLPLLFASLGGLAGILLTKKREYYLFAFFGYGSLIFGVPLMINNVLADKSIVKEIKLRITKKYPRVIKNGGSVSVLYEGHELGFNFSDKLEISKASYVILKLSEGRLGYLIIRDSKLAVN